MSSSNRDLSDWLIVQAEGKSFVGKPSKGWSPDAQLLLSTPGVGLPPQPFIDRARYAGWISEQDGAWLITDLGHERFLRGDWVRLEPVYEYAIVLMNTPQGPQPIPRLQPVWGLLSVSGMIIPARVFVRFADLAAEELKAFTMLVEQTEEGIKQARAQAAGVTLVSGSGPLPPYPGRKIQ